MTKATSRSVQSYLDERPSWTDGTPAPAPPLTNMQQRIWLLAAAGKFFEGLVVFMGGIALPLVVKEFGVSPALHGFVTAASLMGILVGATCLGSLSDVLGRKRLFVFEMFVFTTFLVLACISPNFWWLVVCLFGLGVALGCDYPTAHLIISETTSTRTRGRLVLSAFGFQALGALAGALIGYLILANAQSLEAWRWMYATAIIPAILVTLARLTIPESPHYLAVRGNLAAASNAVQALLARNPPYPKSVSVSAAPRHQGHDASYWALFRKRNQRATLLASIPWFLQDLSTYGIGIFTPVILATAIGHTMTGSSTVATVVHNDMMAAKGAAIIDVLLILGIVCAIFLADRVGRIRLQVIGFVGCAVGLALAASSVAATGATATILLFAGFMIFNLMTNIGPNAQTYLIAGEVFPAEVRGKGAGFAASAGKIGAVITAFFFPVLLHAIGVHALLGILVVASLLGAIITYALRIETAGRSLEAIDAGEPRMTAVAPATPQAAE